MRPRNHEHLRHHWFGAILLCLALICIPSGPAAAAGLVDGKQIAGYNVSIWIDKKPPILGNNNLEIEVRGPDGREVSDAAVLVNYYMPPMPRMAPMNYKTDAPFKNGKYRTVLHFIMEGPWVIAVKINRLGKMATAKFNVDVR